MVLRTFETTEELYRKFKSLCAKEGVNIGEKLNEYIEKELKEHGDGNPSYSLDQWNDNEDFKAVPAVFRNEQDWTEYYKKCNKQDYLDMDKQLRTILHVHNKYGMQYQ